MDEADRWIAQNEHRIRAQRKMEAKKKKSQKNHQPKKRRLSPYEVRDKILARMGFTSYQAYLQSREWKEIRDRVLERENNTCQGCGNPSKCVHHDRYNTASLLGTSLDDLYALCYGCHVFIELTRRGRKRGFGKVRDRLRQLVRKERKRRRKEILDAETAAEVTCNQASPNGQPSAEWESADT